MKTIAEPAFPTGCALVVGGSGGVGRAIVEAFARQGSDVLFTYRSNRHAAEQLVTKLQSLGQRAQTLPYSAAQPRAAHELLQAADAFGPGVHTVVNAAGSDIPMRFISTLEPALWRSVIEADLNGFFDLAQASLPYLRESRGSLVQISSIGLRRWPKRDVLSVAPKAGIESLLRGIAKEEGRFGVRANAVQLGVIDAGLFHRLKGVGFDETWIQAARDNTALKRFGSAEAVAEAVLFLASQQAAYITGQSLKLDGGFSL